MKRAELAQMIDHTLLKPEATEDQVKALAEQARELGVWSICVSPSMIPLLTNGPRTLVNNQRPAVLTRGSRRLTSGNAEGKQSFEPGRPVFDRPPRLAVVCGFPSGAHHPEVKAAEAARARRDGADELDMVVNLRWLMEEDWARAAQDIEAVRAAFPRPGVLKVILETAALTDRQIVRASEVAAAGGADFVKTSTGFHPAGGATTQAVALMLQAVGPQVQVKAAGGIRTTDQALAMIDAGATRLGLSATAQILAGLPE
ncbi:MAG: deoxyribose-phosphate aldolase [Bifidobacteriaceae bacterium]|nr:deoxyribose-phosphate aldolase [Bifidobacteriaceae bacterium]